MNIYIYMYMYIYDFMIRDVTYVYTSNHICSWYIPVVVVCVVYICLVHIQRIWSSSRRCLVAFQHPDPGTFRAKSHSWFMDVGSLNFVQFHRFWMAKWDVLTHPHIPHIPHPNFCNLDHLIVCISIYIYIHIYICIYIYIYRTFFCMVFQVVPTEENFPCLQVVCVHTHVGLWDLSLQDMVSCIIFNQLAVRGWMQKTMPCQVYYIISYHLIVLICIWYASLFLSFIICYYYIYTSNIPSDLTTRWPLTPLWWSRSVVPKKQRLYEKSPNMCMLM